MRVRLAILVFAMLLAFAGAGPGKAACVADQQIFAPYSYLYTPGIINGHLDSTVTADFQGAFWALAAGHPATQAGVDNGKFVAIDGNAGGWLTIRPRVGAYGYPPAIESSWNANALIDGCIDSTGSDPEAPDLQQCLVALFGDQHSGAGFFAVTSAPADAAGDYDLTVPGDLPIVLAEVPRPVADFDPYLQDPINALTLDPPLLDGSGQYLHRDCADVITGYRVYQQTRPRGSAPPVDRARDDGDGVGWEVALGGQRPSGQPLPLHEPAALQFSCLERSDVYLAFSLTLDSGFETPFLSRNHVQFAVDCCADADGDGVCAEPSEMREHDCDDANPFCSSDCADADMDLHCVPEDCDDSDPTRHSDVPEVCDGIDNDCDGRNDEAAVSLATLGATGTASGGRFGEGLAPLGDVDNDGYGDFVVSASLDTEAGFPEAGSATVFSGWTGTILQRIEHPGPQAGDHFGGVVTRIGDVNADAIDDLLVGAAGDASPAGPDTGAAFVFSGSRAAAFARVHTLFDAGGLAMDGFGSSVAALDDHNDDGTRDVAVGAPGADGSRGKVLVFSGAGGYLLRTLTDPAGQPGDRFGCAVQGVGDLNGDGLGELLAASCDGDSVVASGAGTVIVFDGASWQPMATLHDPLGEAGDGFGESLTGVDDVDGDSIPEILVGVPGDDDEAGADSGSAIVFSGATQLVLYRLGHPAAAAGDGFGAQVALLGDLDGDGTVEIGVGVPGDDTPGGVDAGSVHVFSGASGLWLQELQPSTPAAGAAFGSSLAAVGNLDNDSIPDLVVGAAGADSDSGPGTGNAEMFAGAGAQDGDRDGFGDRCDCAPGDPDAQIAPTVLQGVVVGAVAPTAVPTVVQWQDPGPGFRFDVVGGLLSELLIDGGLTRSACLVDDAPGPTAQDSRPAPPPGDGYYYLPRSQNACGNGSYGFDSEGVERVPGADCP